MVFWDECMEISVLEMSGWRWWFGDDGLEMMVVEKNLSAPNEWNRENYFKSVWLYAYFDYFTSGLISFSIS